MIAVQRPWLSLINARMCSTELPKGSNAAQANDIVSRHDYRCAGSNHVRPALLQWAAAENLDTT
jgi:hypothetical protein